MAAAEFPDHASVGDAHEAAAKGLTKSASGEGQSVTYASLSELAEAERYVESKKSAKVKTLGLYFRKLIPPGTG